jgi:hypothetical protein
MVGFDLLRTARLSLRAISQDGKQDRRHEAPSPIT